MAATVLDASALLAHIKVEPGSGVVDSYLGDAAISAVNLQEVAKVLFLDGLSQASVSILLAKYRLDVHPHGEADALAAAALVLFTKRHGSGLGDRTCMALAIRLGIPALTTERAWAKLAIPGLQVVLAR